jgi:hypothetical protein
MTSDAGATIANRQEPDVASGLTGELTAALAAGERALYADGDLLASRDCFERAFQLATPAGSEPARAMAALGLAGLWVSESRTVTGSVMLSERLGLLLPHLGAQAELGLRIRARLAAEADYRRGENAAILAVLGEARSAGNPVPLAEALSLAHHCLLGPDYVTVRRELAVELIKASFRTGRRSDLLMGLMWQTADAYSAGDPHAGRYLGELRDELARHDHSAVGFVVSAMEVMLAIRDGDFEEAESLVTICAKNGATAGDVDTQWWPGGQLVTIRWFQGRLAELRPMLAERVRSPALSAVDNSAVAALAVAAALDGDRRTAASGLAVLRGNDLAALPRSSSWLVTMAGIIETACQLEDHDIAAEAYDLLLPYAHLPMVGSLGVTCFGSAHHALGVASLTTGHHDRAVDHLRAAVRHNLALAHWPALALSRRRLAQVFQLRGHDGDQAAAHRELGVADMEARATGMRTSEQHRSMLARSARTMECVRAGRKWRLVLGERSVLIDDSIGLRHLAVLIANPRRDIAAADLVAGVATLSGRVGGGGEPQAVLDGKALADYRHRTSQLDAEIAALETAGHAERLRRARAEREWLSAQLASASGLGGRVRSFPDEPERARVSVGKAIRRALVRIAEADPVIGQHLRQGVHTGARCSYWPG